MPCATWYEGTAQLLSLTELKSHLSFISLAEPVTDEGGEETGILGKKKQKNPGDELQKTPHSKARGFKPLARLEPALVVG